MTKYTFLPAALLAVALAGAGASMLTAQTTPDAPAAQDQRADQPGERDAHRGGHGNHGGPRGDRAGGGRGGPGMLRAVFAAADANGDGVLTQAEIDAYRTAKVSEADVSGDGALSIAEFETLYAKATRERMVDAFQDLDANGDGVINAAEIDARIARIVERMDRDGNGALTLRDRGHRG